MTLEKREVPKILTKGDDLQIRLHENQYDICIESNARSLERISVDIRLKNERERGLVSENRCYSSKNFLLCLRIALHK